LILDGREETDNTGFIQCLKIQFWKRLQQTIACRLPGFEEFMDNGTKLEKCSDRGLALNATHEFRDLVLVSLATELKVEPFNIPGYQHQLSLEVPEKI
jgi:hypothetical protein